MTATNRVQNPIRTPGKATVCADVVAEIKALLLSSQYRHGTKLPSERELSEQLGVSRASVREALRTLGSMGVIETRRGSGTRMTDTGTNVLKAPFEFMVLLDKPSLSELYETRELIEVYLAERAAERGTAEEIAVIAEALADMQRHRTHPEQFIDPNLRFHEAVAAAAHAPMLRRFMSCLHDAIREGMEVARPGVRDWNISYDIHAQIYDAIRRRSGSDARRAMALHMAVAIEELRHAVPDAFGNAEPPPPLTEYRINEITP